MKTDSIINDRTRSRTALERGLKYRGEIEPNKFKRSYPAVNRMTLEHLQLYDSSFKWFRFRQHSIEKLTVNPYPDGKKSFYAKIPARMIQRCRSLNIAIMFEDAPLDQILARILKRAKNISKAEIFFIYTFETFYKSAEHIRAYLRTLSSSCHYFHLGVSTHFQPNFEQLTILKDSIRTSNILKHLKVHIPVNSKFDFIEDHQQTCSLETLSFALSTEGFEDNRFWNFLAKQNKLHSFGLKIDDDFNFQRVFMVMSELENLKNFRISIEANPINTMNLLKAHLNTKTKFKSLEIALAVSDPEYDFKFDETHLSFISQIFGGSFALLIGAVTLSVTSDILRFKQNHDGENYNLVEFDWPEPQNRNWLHNDEPFFLQYMDDSWRQLKQTRFRINDYLDPIPFFSDKLSQPLLLEKLTLSLNFTGQNMKTPRVSELLNILGTKVFSQTQHLTELSFTITLSNGSFDFQTLFTQAAYAICELRNLRLLRFDFCGYPWEKGSIASIVHSLKQMKKLENFHFSMGATIDEKEIENLMAELANLKYLSAVTLRLLPNQLSEKLPNLINQLKQTERFDMYIGLKETEKEISKDNALKLFQTLRKELVHQQTMKIINVNFGVELNPEQIQELKFPNNWRRDANWFD